MKINSVLGPIDHEDLGLTLVHEHLVGRSEAVTVQFPHLYSEEFIYDKAIESVKAIMARGVKTICDPTVLGLGRDIRFMERIAKDTGLQIIAATGIYTMKEIPTFFQNRTIDFMADVFIHDIEVGVQNTDIKAGFLKCGADDYGVNEDLEKVFRAVARASIKTGVPIMTHSHPVTKNGLDQIRIFEEENVPMSSIMIGHTGDTEDRDHIQEILDKGVYIGMDRYGIMPPETVNRQQVTLEFIQKGYANKLFLSQDYCCTLDWYPLDHPVVEIMKDWSMTMLLDEIIPNLEKEGVHKSDLKRIMEDNVVAWFNVASTP